MKVMKVVVMFSSLLDSYLNMLTYTLRFICYTLHVETAAAYCTSIICKAPGEGTYSVCPDKLDTEFTD